MRRDGRTAWLSWALAVVLLVAAAVVVVLTVRQWRPGDFDPVGASMSLIALSLAVLAMRQAARQERQSEQDLGLWSEALRRQVRTVTSAERRRLLLSADQAIDVDFVLQPA